MSTAADAMRAFLLPFFGLADQGVYPYFWFLQDKKTYDLHGRTLEQACELAARLARGGDVYVSTSLGRERLRENERHKQGVREPDAVMGFQLDLDYGEHHQKRVPPTRADALSLIPPDLPASAIIASGGGFHAWWLPKEIAEFEGPEDRERWRRAKRRWHQYFHSQAQLRGFEIDNTSDLERILRVPGTLNHKLPGRPRPVVLESLTGRRYELSDIIEWLDRQGAPDVVHTPERPRAAPLADVTLSDDERTHLLTVLECGVESDPDFARLAGGSAAGFPSESEADLSFCYWLARIFRGDERLIGATFALSGRMRPKWASRRDYRERTIARACTSWRKHNAEVVLGEYLPAAPIDLDLPALPLRKRYAL